MANVIEKKGKKYWKNGQAELIPANRIFPHEKRSDKLVEKIHNKVEKLAAKIAEEKKKIEKDITKYLTAVAVENGAKEFTGNSSIFNFEKSKQIEIKLSKHFITDERLQVAKQVIDELILEWSKDSNGNVVALINKAFKTDKKGNIDVKTLLGLREIKITDKRWKKAMDLISDSISVDSTKTYMVFRQRDVSGKLISIPLNYSAL